MAERYVVFDVETPNSYNDRMSAIGVSIVENGEIIREFASLIHPETHFDRFNVELTGITPEMTQDAPSFPQLWQELAPLFSDGLLIAHNAPFDMSVLGKCLRAYRINWKPTAEYACTCQMSRRCYPKMPNHKLNTLCDYLHIALEHHQAASDSHACAELLLACLSRGVEIGRFRRIYDFRTLRTLHGANCGCGRR